MKKTKPRPYMNPYIAGVGLGFVILITFILVGRGIGVSGAIAKSSATLIDVSTSVNSHSNDYISEYSLRAKSVLDYWILIEVLGIFLGGYISSKISGRRKVQTIKGQHIQNQTRYKYALIGGVLMGFGSRLARGCTSGQALTGGALLNLGSWVFMISIFIGGYLLAKKMKWTWV